MNRIKARDIARRERRHIEQIGRGARGTSTISSSELRNYAELSRSRPTSMATYGQVPQGAYGGLNGVGLNTTQLNSTPAAGDPPLFITQ